MQLILRRLLIGPVVACGLALAGLILTAAAEEADDRPLRVLLVTGEDFEGHHWRETAPAIRDMLENDRRFKVRIVEDADFLASPTVNDYDVVLLHLKNYKTLPNEVEVRRNLAEFVRQGKGLVVLHFASGAFEDWPEYATLIGRVWDPAKRGHDPRGPFQVRIVAPDHPVTAGIDDFEADDELYTCLVGDRPITVLAEAASKVDGETYPIAFVLEYGRGRVFHTSLGHDVRAIAIPSVGRMLSQACIWASGDY